MSEVCKTQKVSGFIGIFRETQWWGIENFEIQLMTEKQTSFGAESKLFVHQKKKKKEKKKEKIYAGYSY